MVLAALILSAACTEPGRPPPSQRAEDAGRRDSGTRSDAGTTDARTDAGPRTDAAGGVDANQSGDAGPTADAGPTGDAQTAPTDPFDPIVRAQQVAVALCAHRETCEPIWRDYLPETRAECEAKTNASQLSYFEAIAPLIQAGRVGFSQSEHARCVASFETARNDCAVGLDVTACGGMFTGTRQSGAACGASEECADGLWCPLASLGACGTCQPEAGVGDDCSNNVCADGLECLQLDATTSACVPVTAGLGAACNTLATGLCRGALQCIGPDEGPFTCARPAARGATCELGGVAPDCNVYQNDVCVNGTCAALEVVAPPAACGQSQPTRTCNAESQCEGAVPQCTALPTAGGTCSADLPCGSGFFCSGTGATGTCTALIARGSSCTASDVCAANSYCIGGTCAALRYNASCN